MFLSWRRPDGFHNSKPEDFFAIELKNNSRLWLHRSEAEWFPFKVSGGWQDEDSTKKINQFVNLIPEPAEKWKDFIRGDFENSKIESKEKYFSELVTWLKSLKDNRKGDAWELEIMDEAIETISQLVHENKP